MIKVYNKGNKPLVYKRSHEGTLVIHPKKFQTFGDDEGAKMIKKFANAVNEKDFNKYIESLKTTTETTIEDK